MSKRSNFRRGYSKREEAWQPPKKKYEPPPKKLDERSIVQLTVIDAYGERYVYEKRSSANSMHTVPGTGEMDNTAYVQRDGTGSLTVTFPARCSGGITVSI